MTYKLDNKRRTIPLLELTRFHSDRMYATSLPQTVSVAYEEGMLDTMTVDNFVRVAISRYGQDSYAMLVQEVDAATQAVLSTYKAVFDLLVAVDDQLMITCALTTDTAPFSLIQ
jgi:hypothetical protein